MTLHHMVVSCAVFVFVYSIITDLASRTIYNKACIGLIVSWLIAAWLFPDTHPFLSSLCAGLLVLAVGMVFHFKKWLGGGDVKLFAAAALWVGWLNLSDFVLTVSMIGGVLALAWIGLGRVADYTGSATLARHAKELPYGVAIASTAIVFVLTDLRA